ncbi:E3 ubiquitin-protein ligase TRIM32-like [Thrips palmi]|uniref:E3 ubiquitin-protein ligase TRIM32-like n=1 Tax=Thrips palmi TaxID=161013 RepID=A0A6P8Z131_THRPL|nr:E3 ubiquitin-protein ligase TRIM32-like [Thrips palmi]XP_034246151.1 E3 ubiquitin-protein ligase TRIM32-like [Thrips palmi]XP_034246152.1 E3 ubiquitin-protein ligase TRIM32-like [Thrips palmi]XP_034246153.1 E3 ubiquitin-protein ligase TRIM32-like [Thrips palmi]XP_034246154.1 E3 ubiquitin-protein ligase TRIM32-like [Thrips palmi]XP_034246155.1 E3 ubiquitin-protein ligase TRIM32-like [Thrips palmi]XP_034246156.1 E3 ubiquitin-protein ligase TRIM32-like [Thrips palmi]XP_034246157.1 E3 ubiquit
MECQVCMLAFDDRKHRPKVLPCGHSYCLCCLKQLRSRRCPVDSKVFEAAPDDLLDNFIVLEATNKPVETAAPRFWCLRCKRDATHRCEEEHPVCSLKKARAMDAAPLLEALQEGEAAVAELRDTLDDVVRELGDFRDELEQERTSLASARERLQDALTAAAHGAAWEQVKQAAVLSGLSRTAARLVADLGDPGAACSLQVRRGADGGVAWRGEVLPAETPRRDCCCAVWLAVED